jgi:hypothetical protein
MMFNNYILKRKEKKRKEKKNINKYVNEIKCDFYLSRCIVCLKPTNEKQIVEV